MTSGYERLPVLIGVGRVTEKNGELGMCSPVQLMAKASEKALIDMGKKTARDAGIDAVAVVGFVFKGVGFGLPRLPRIEALQANAAGSLSSMLGLSEERDHTSLFHTPDGGNMPQMLVNHFAEKIAAGQLNCVLLSGAEALDNLSRIVAQEGPDGLEARWGSPGMDISSWKPSSLIGKARRGVSDHEGRHGLDTPVQCYALFENSYRNSLGRSVDEHLLSMGKLMEHFTNVAAANPSHSWFPKARSAVELATPGPNNRFVGHPYTKYFNSVIQVNQAASVILCSVAHARRLGVDEKKWVFLHGCGDANDVWNMTERPCLHDSPAMRAMNKRALKMAGITDVRREISFFDLYSCFPIAVEVAANVLGLPQDGSIPLTVTGGLPYHGGPGNNYVMHSIAAIVEKLRAHPGKKGMITGNGMYLTKHSVGIYSTAPPPASATGGVSGGVWQREDPATYEAEAQPLRLKVDEKPRGPAVVESYTVVFDKKNQPKRAIIIGRMKTGERCRFAANTAIPREDIRRWFLAQDRFGAEGFVETDEKGQVWFTPDEFLASTKSKL